MLLEFTIKNYKSFADEQTISLLASGNEEHPQSDVISVSSGKSFNLLRSAAIYGPNASGKSNLILALDAMRDVVRLSANLNAWGAPGIGAIVPFMLDAHSQHEPTLFEIIFFSDAVRFQYGFEATRKEIISEWLYAFPHNKAQRWFERDYHADHPQGNFNPGDYFTGNKAQIWEATRPDALLLSTAAQLNNEVLSPIYNWFNQNVAYFTAATISEDISAQMSEHEPAKKELVDFLNKADVGIQDFAVTYEQLSPGFAMYVRESGQTSPYRFTGNDLSRKIQFAHKGAAGEDYLLDFELESEGTKRFFAIAGPILDALKKGQVLVVDELGSSLHPKMLEAIVQLFNAKETNPNNAQLIFSTHNTSLLTQKLFRRDQIWITEKNNEGKTQLIPLSDFKPRKGSEVLEKNYLQGRYGGIPLVQLKRAARSIHYGEES